MMYCICIFLGLLLGHRSRRQLRKVNRRLIARLDMEMQMSFDAKCQANPERIAAELRRDGYTNMRPSRQHVEVN